MDQEREVIEEADPLPKPGMVLPIALFIATVFTTLWAGAYQDNPDRFHPFLGAWRFLVNDPAALLNGVPFSATLLAILVTHEFGHYVWSRLHRVPASLPLFIPGLPVLVGTFGAVIRMRSPIMSRKALFDIGVAGPVAGFVVAIIALAIGLRLSTLIRIVDIPPGIVLGAPLVLDFMTWLTFGSLPNGFTVDLHPIAVAAWFGLFVTSLNLIPIGQLDGGHVAYALWGDRQRSIAVAMLPILLVLGFVGWQGWLLWAGLAGLLGLGHPPVQDPEATLGRTRVWVGWGALVIFLITFAPIPISVG